MKTSTVAWLSIAFGAGAAILASLGSGLAWYNSRQWNEQALHATFDHLDTEGAGGTVVFCYQVENRTDSDYEILPTSEVALMARLKKPYPWSPGYQVLAWEHALRIPAGKRGLLRIPFGRVHQEPPGTDATPEQWKLYRERLLTLVGQQHADLEGFVLYDRKNRYRVVFPRGWSQEQGALPAPATPPHPFGVSS